MPPPATHKESFKPWCPSPKEIQALEGAEPIACQGELLFNDGLSSSYRLLQAAEVC